jgi:hypothetical protein
MSARLMQTDGGTVTLIAAGVIIVAVGGYHIYKGASRNFLDDLKGDSSDLVRRLGTVGTSPKDWSSPVPGFWSLSRRVVRSRTRPPVSTGLSKRWGHNPTEQRCWSLPGWE